MGNLTSIFDSGIGYSWTDASAEEWVESHEGPIRAYLSERYDQYADIEHILNLMLRYPVMARLIMEDEEIDAETKISEIVDLMTRPGVITAVGGDRGKGKTDFVTMVAERAYEDHNKPIYVLGVPGQPVPDFAELTTSPHNVRGDAFTIVDESAIHFDNRTSMRGEQRDSIHPLHTLRHANRSICFIAQAIDDLDKKIRRHVTYVVQKPQSRPLHYLDSNTRQGSDFNQALDLIKPRSVKDTLFWKGGLNFMTIYPTPEADCWTEELSKAFQPIYSKEEAIKRATELFKDWDCSVDQVKNNMDARAFVRPRKFWIDLQKKLIREKEDEEHFDEKDAAGEVTADDDKRVQEALWG